MQRLILRPERPNRPARAVPLPWPTDKATLRLVRVRSLHGGCTVIPSLTSEGLLPCGRFQCSSDEVEAVFLGNERRAKVWDDFLAVADLLRRRRVRLPSAFVSGSFVTSVDDPGDVDAAFLYDASAVTRPETHAELARIAGSTKDELALEVDALLIGWHPQGYDLAQQRRYRQDRGYWDDFWQRHVLKADRDPEQRHHAFPVRGYLEVILDGYR